MSVGNHFLFFVVNGLEIPVGKIHICFQIPPKKKSRGIKCVDLGGQFIIFLLLPIRLAGKVVEIQANIRKDYQHSLLLL